MILWISFAIVLLLFQATAMAADGQIKTVVATGVSPIQGGNIEGARQYAIQDALRQAVEQGVGMVMDATSIVQDDDLMEKIYSHTMGHVTEYKVLKEKQMPNGLFKVKLQALVNTGGIKSALVKHGIFKPMMDYPRIMILPFPYSISGQSAETVEAGMIKHLTGRKYDLVDPVQSRKLHSDIKTLFDDEGANAAAARIGLDHQAEIVILYGLKQLNSQFDGVMESVPVELSTRCIVTTTAQILTADNVSATGMGQSQDHAATNGALQAAEKTCAQLSDSILTWWTDYTANGIPYYITLKTKPGSVRKIIDFQESLGAIPGVMSVSERSSGGGITQMMVKYKFDTIQLKKGILDQAGFASGFNKLDVTVSKGRFIVLAAN
jgi:hypothetical protein